MNDTTSPSACRACGRSLTHAPKQGKRKTFCDPRCWRAHNNGNVKASDDACGHCGKTFVNDIHKCGRRRRYCGDACRRAADELRKYARRCGQNWTENGQPHDVRDAKKLLGQALGR